MEKIFNDEVSVKKAQSILDEFIKLAPAQQKAKLKTENILKNPAVLSLSENLTTDEVLSKAAGIDEALRKAKSLDQPIKKIRVFDFDDTLARTNSNVLYTMPDGTTGKLTAEEFAKKGDEMVAQGVKWDFSEFNKVVDGKKGPLFEIAKKIQEVRGTEDVFVLTARSSAAAPAIKELSLIHI